MGKARLLGTLLQVGAACALLAACSSDWTPAAGWPPLDISGEYLSQEPVGQLGILSLELERVEQSRVFSALLSSADAPDLGETEGVGTLGDMHLVLNFGRGSLDDYYFEGQVEAVGGSVVSITGEFILPDLAQPVPAVFH